MRRGQNFVELPVTGTGGSKVEGGQADVGKAVKSHAAGSDRPVDRPSADRPPSLVSYCLNRRTPLGPTELATCPAPAAKPTQSPGEHVVSPDCATLAAIYNPSWGGLP